MQERLPVAPKSMSQVKTFTLEEARALVPKLRQLISDGNVELEKLALKLEENNARFETAELNLAQARSAGDNEEEIKELRELRLHFQDAIELLSRTQQEYLERLNHWVDLINGTGVILRDLRTGLLDFPARQGKFTYFLCWKLSDTELDYWHLQHDGFIGRRPLAVLQEYF
ncbi:MAG: DUF2203 domain-containing protein [Terriglobales bacterium]